MGGGGGEVPDETPAYRALAEQTVQYYNRFVNVFQPLEDMYISEVFRADDAGQYRKAMDSATSAVQSEFEPRLQQLGQKNAGSRRRDAGFRCVFWRARKPLYPARHLSGVGRCRRRNKQHRSVSGRC